jgi:hypothetical protein
MRELKTTALAGLLALSIPAAAQTKSTAPAGTAVDRGKYLVWAGGCNDCHTPKKMGARGPELDTARLLSGARDDAKLPPPPKLPEGPWMAVAAWDLTAWSGPWGISYAINLTPDETTGIGIWTEEMFLKSIREGRHMGASRPVLPPMPWETIRNYTDGDLKAIFAYLRSVPAIKNRVPEAVVAEPTQSAGR